jgi:hypothetical protein
MVKATIAAVMPAQAGIQYSVRVRMRDRRVLDHPPEPVIGRRFAPTRWRMMTVLNMQV